MLTTQATICFNFTMSPASPTVKIGVLTTMAAHIIHIEILTTLAF